jgi:hypothetical protein
MSYYVASLKSAIISIMSVVLFQLFYFVILYILWHLNSYYFTYFTSDLLCHVFVLSSINSIILFRTDYGNYTYKNKLFVLYDLFLFQIIIRIRYFDSYYTYYVYYVTYFFIISIQMK